ncbi:MAG: hypothetical protein BMS9Abin25_1302 [Gammaproteobacteria bacterium]|nr:MAG: hypothetical protein BMS9Abin25_1302 [Gammaproteobacteria bacterium]
MKKEKDQIVHADTEEGQRVGEGIVEAIENQIKEKNPLETTLTLERLMGNGESRENAMRYIASAFTIELFEIMKSNKPYNEERYINNLKALPRLPDD